MSKDFVTKESIYAYVPDDAPQGLAFLLEHFTATQHRALWQECLDNIKCIDHAISDIENKETLTLPTPVPNSEVTYHNLVLEFRLFTDKGWCTLGDLKTFRNMVSALMGEIAKVHLLRAKAMNAKLKPIHTNAGKLEQHNDN